MSDLIDREQAKDAIDKYLVGRNLVTDGTFMARLINEIVIDRLPSAQPKRGKWICTGEPEESWGMMYECSICGNHDHGGNYCSYCGAKMEDEDE